MSMPAHEVSSWLIDMDGVLVREEHPIDGAARFLTLLHDRQTPFLVLTNNSIYTPRDLRARLRAQRHRRARGVDLDVGAGHRPVPRRPAAGRHGVRDR